MSYLYFDESIRDRGGFIIAALVGSESNLTERVRDLWREMNLDPDKHEYKSSSPKHGDPIGHEQRDRLGDILQRSRLALVVVPIRDRRKLGKYCTDLVLQLYDRQFLRAGNHSLFVDQNIRVSTNDRSRLSGIGIDCYTNMNSRIEAGIQLADHASHALGGMLLEEMGMVKKLVLAGENSGYSPQEKLELGFELWARLRYALVGNNEYIDGLTDPEDPETNPYFRVEGYGLLIAKSCSDNLTAHARKRFGTNYLGCIH